MTRPAPTTRVHGPKWVCSPFAAIRSHANARAQIPAAMPSPTAPARSANESGGAPRDFEQWCDAVDGDEREVARRRRDQRGQQHAPGEILLVRHLEGEDRAGGRCLEDGGDAGGCARHQQHAPTAPGGEAWEAPLEERPEVRAQVERSAFEAHRAPERGRRDRRQHPTGELAEAVRLLGIVERLEVEVGHARVA